jgi:EamA domain-containing membrane protein RarD
LLLITAVLVYGEPFTPVQGWTFVIIWTVLAIYSIDSVRTYRRRP